MNRYKNLMDTRAPRKIYIFMKILQSYAPWSKNIAHTLDRCCREQVTLNIPLKLFSLPKMARTYSKYETSC